MEPATTGRTAMNHGLLNQTALCSFFLPLDTMYMSLENHKALTHTHTHTNKAGK